MRWYTIPKTTRRHINPSDNLKENFPKPHLNSPELGAEFVELAREALGMGPREQ